MNTTEKEIFSDKALSSHITLNNLGEEIMSLWESRVRGEVESAGDLLRPALRDALPRFLNLLAKALSETESRGMIEEGSDLVKEHAADRARDTGFGPSEIVQELQMLRETVINSLEKEIKLSKNDYETIQKTFDQAIQEALIEFFLVHAKIREQFMATLSHDLRNPIGVARMGAELIQSTAQEVQDSRLRDDLMDLSERIIVSTKRADRMIQDLLDASILRVGEKIPIKLSRCDLLTIAHDVVTEIDHRDRPRFQIIGSSAPGYWDCDGLRRSLENLVRNAIKYGFARSPITIRVERHDGRARLSVHNQGNPIPVQDQKLIFRTFRRSRSAQEGAQQGWGIGLALVQSVSKSLGGSIQVESSKEAGTTFTIDLPDDSRPYQRSVGQFH